MKKIKNEFENISTDDLKKEYITLCFGAMIYGADTETKRHKIADEIERRNGWN